MNRPTRVFLSLTLSLLLLTSACQPAPTAEPTADVSPLTGLLSEANGAVSLKPASASDFAPAAVGTSLKALDQVKTGEDGRARIDLSSGTIIRVVPSSIVTLQSNEETSDGLKTGMKLDLGQIFIILTGGSMDVETPSGVASVRGSYMMVHVADNKDVLITCLEGHCSASNPAGSVDFTGGQKVTLFHYDVPGDARAPEAEDMNEEDFNTWLEDNPEAKTIYEALVAELTAQAPTATTVPSPTTEPTKAPSPTSAAAACVQLLSPTTGSELGISGPAEFSWSEYPGATKYRLTIHFPSGATAVVDTTDTSSTRYLDVFNEGGSFSWDVTVLDAQGNVVCQSSSSSFNKPAPSGGSGNSNGGEQPPRNSNGGPQ